MKPFASNFISTFLGVVVASLVIAFFALMWERSARVTIFEDQIQIQKTVDKSLADEIGKLKAEHEQVHDYLTMQGMDVDARAVESAQEAVQQTLDKAVYREKELRK